MARNFSGFYINIGGFKIFEFSENVYRAGYFVGGIESIVFDRSTFVCLCSKCDLELNDQGIRIVLLFSFQLPVIKELGDAAFDFVFEDSELLAKVTEGIDHVTCKKNIVNKTGLKQVS